MHAEITSTFPLRVAEAVWGEGMETHTERFDLNSTHKFAKNSYDWTVQEPTWKGARVSVWDIAGGGTFSNPAWR